MEVQAKKKDLDVQLFKRGLIDGFSAAELLARDFDEIKKYGKNVYDALMNVPEEAIPEYVSEYLYEHPQMKAADYVTAITSGFQFFLCLYEVGENARFALFGKGKVSEILSIYRPYYIIDTLYHEYVNA